jgi:hypothetical protein
MDFNGLCCFNYKEEVFQNPLKSIQDSEVVYANSFYPFCKSNLKIVQKKMPVLFLIKFMFEVRSKSCHSFYC